MRAFVDRIEGDGAVLLIGGREWTVPAALLPDDAGEGDAVELTARRAAAPRPPPDVPWKGE